MQDGQWVRQSANTATHLVRTEWNSQKRRYNGQAGQETNHEVMPDSYIELLSRDINSKRSLQAKYPPRSTDNRSTHTDVWVTSKGARWTSAWESLHSQLDDIPRLQEVKELYQSSEDTDELTSPIAEVQTGQLINDDDHFQPPSKFSSSATRRVENVYKEPKIDDTKPSLSKDILEPLLDVLPEIKTDRSKDSQLLAEVPEEDTPTKTSIESSEQSNQDIGDEEFLEKVQFAPPKFEKDLALYAEMPLKTEIHILGTNPLGLYIAHSLCSSLEPPPVTLLIHRPLLMQQWHDEGAAIRVVKNGTIYSTSKINLESSAPFGVNDGTLDRDYAGFGKHLEHTIEQPNTRISNLLVTTDGPATISGLKAIRHRLDNQSTVCFINDGLGIVEEVNNSIFPQTDSRPFYMQGRNSHNIRPIDNHKFSIIEQEKGDLSFTICNRTVEGDWIAPKIVKTHMEWGPSARYILRRFSSHPELRATGYHKLQFLEKHLLKAAIHSILGPSSVMFDCFCNELLYNRSISEFATSLLEEISSVLVALPEMERFKGRFKAFSVQRMQKIMVRQCMIIGRNRTSMWHDVDKGRKTDIDYYNGYFIKRGKELGIDCPRLKMVTTMVKAKQMMKKQAMDNYIQWDGAFKKESRS